MNHTPALCLLALVALISSSTAQDLPPPNIDSILKELDLIASGAKNQIANRRNSAIGQIQAASGSGASAVSLYLQSLDGTKYKESHNDFIEWQRKNGDLFRSSTVGAAAQLQLQYLLLALQRSEKNDAFAQIPACQSYLSALATVNTSRHPQNQKNIPKSAASEAADKSYEAAGNLINHPINDSAVVQFFQIEDLLPEGKDFASSPGNYDQILEKNIRVPLRAKNDPRLLATWDQQMNYDAAMATATGSQQQADQFNQTELPDLLFKKAKDAAAIGQPNRALISIVDLIHHYPTSPDVNEWVETARGLTTNAVTPTAGVAAATNTNPPTTPPPSQTPPAPPTNTPAHP